MDRFDEFETVAIVGVGLIGGSLGLALKHKGFAGKIIGIDRQGNLDNAFARKAIDEGLTREHLVDGVSGADITFLCAPIHVILKQIKEIGDNVKPGAIITDVGSIKRQIIETANDFLPLHCHFVGGHPMAGSEFKGIEAADHFLFENATWVLTPSKPIEHAKIKALVNMLEGMGAKVLVMQAGLHDEIAAAVSHLPQMSAVALMNLVGRRNEESAHFLKMAAGGFRDMTRIASSPFSVWESICSVNADMIENYIDAYVEELQHLKSIIREPHDLEKYFFEAARNRLSIPTDTKGFLKPQFEISVTVEDRPGIIARIATILANHQINIKDMEVLKIREDEGGTFRLAFSGQQEQETAIGLLSAEGFDCRKRG